MSTKGFVGNIFMVAGCSMGAGCLALPMLSAGIGFIASSLAIILVGFFSLLVANVSLEIFILHKNDVNTSSVVKYSFGVHGAIFSAIINILLMYALLSVYMTGGADMVNATIFPLLHLNSNTTYFALMVILLISIPIFTNGAKVVVKSNEIVFYIKLISFLVAVVLGLKFLSHNLRVYNLSYMKYIPKALPIYFGALWFHFLIPVIAKMNDYDRGRCKRIFLVGLAVPVILYILWIAIMLSLIARTTGHNSFYELLHNRESVGAMISAAIHNNPFLPTMIKLAINIFSNIALLTSFLSVGISTYDYIRDALAIKQHARGRFYTLALTMLPPAFFAIFFPNGFVPILQQAMILLTLVNIIILGCCLKEYERLFLRPKKMLIYILLFLLVVIIVLQLLDDFNILSSFGFS